MLDVQKIRHKAENMSRMKTFICAGTLSLLGAFPAWSLNSITDVFAGCAGRYSAEMEHAWLMGADTAAHFADQRLAFVGLVEATKSDGEGRAILHRRIEAKQAHARLLQIATFHEDKRSAQMARNTAMAHLSSCGKLLLGG